jgi:hypothetical protein
MKEESLKADSEHPDEQSERVTRDALGTSVGDAAQPGEAGVRAAVVEIPDTAVPEQERRPVGKQASLAAAAGSSGADSGPRVDHRSSRRRRSMNSIVRKLERATRTIRYQRIVMVMLAGIAVLILVVTVGISTSAGKKERDMEFRLNRKDIEITKLRVTVEEQRESIKGFVNERLPGLIDMEFDRVFEVDHPYVRTIAFTNVRTKQKGGYEFRIVLENQRAPIVAPAVDIILFGALGLEIDRRKLRVDRGVNTIEIEILSRGDVRSYVDSFNVQPDAAPAYFLVR